MAFLETIARTGFHRRGVATLALLLLALASPAVRAQPQAEYELKALFFTTLPRYTRWPTNAFENPASPLVIGVLGNNPFGVKKLQSLVSKEQVQGRSVQVKQFQSVDEIEACHMLFVGNMSPALLELSLARLARKPILTVSDRRTFIQSGGMVELFINDENRVRLKVSRSAIQKAGLDFTPTVWKLADVVAMEEISPLTFVRTIAPGEPLFLAMNEQP